MSATSLIQKDPNGVRRALILAGGGVRLAYQAGVLQALAEKGLQFGHFDGTSGGIFNTAMLASGLDPDEMARRWRSLRLKDFMSTLHFRQHYAGTLAFGDSKSFVSYRPAFHFRRWGHEVALDVDASVFAATLGREIATFNNKAELKRGPQGAYIQVTSEFEHDRQMYALQATIRLGTPIEWWLGLEFKRVKLQIDRNTENLLHGQLTQSIKKRFKGILNSSLRHFYGPGGNLREKRRMIFYLYRHEI